MSEHNVYLELEVDDPELGVIVTARAEDGRLLGTGGMEEGNDG